MELTEDILEIGESLFESDYAVWFENTNIFVKKQYKHAIEMLRFEDSVKANAALYKTAAVGSLKKQEKDQTIKASASPTLSCFQ